MATGSLLDAVVYAFRDLFGSQNFALFSAYVWGVILCQGRHTVTGIYLASQPENSQKLRMRSRMEPQALKKKPRSAGALEFEPEVAE